MKFSKILRLNPLKKIQQLRDSDALKTRSGKIFSNVSLSLVLKFANMLISFVMVPITLGYLDKTRYGLWAALSSTLTWFFMFDVGIGNGLKNRYIEFKAKADRITIRKYVSTSYFLFGVMALLISIVFFVANQFIDWSRVLNAPSSMRSELETTVLVVFIAMSVNFVFRLVNNILIAELKTALVDASGVVSHLITLLGLLILVRISESSILRFALVYLGSNLFVTLLLSIWVYGVKYRDIAPHPKYIDVRLRRDLLSTGMKFFFLQIMGIVFFQSTSFIISALVNPEAVTEYNITKRYFDMLAMLFTMMHQPLWSGYGEAYHSLSFDWIKKVFKLLLKLWGLLTVGLFGMMIVQAPVFKIWLKGRIEVDYTLSALFVIFMSMQMIHNIYLPFINSTSKIRLQTIANAISVPIFLTLAFVFIKTLSMGSIGLLLALIICRGIPMAILAPMQSYKILSGAKGLWDK